MMWTHWVAVEHEDYVEACPLEMNEDGVTIDAVVTGMTFITSLEGLKERATYIALADDMYTLDNLRKYWSKEDE